LRTHAKALKKPSLSRSGWRDVAQPQLERLQFISMLQRNIQPGTVACPEDIAR
jgi:hypothetical protein